MNQASRVSPRSLVSCLTSWLGISALLMSPALAQVNGPGLSPANLFDTVLNLPGDEAVISGGVGGVTGQTTQLNVNAGGEVGVFFDALSGSEVNVSGGYVDALFDALLGSEVNISGGTVDGGFSAHDGSVVNISGGTLGTGFEAFVGSDVGLIGGEFRLNGADFSGSTITLTNNDVFTGTFADGSSFIFADGLDRLTNVSLITFPFLPVADLNPIVINSPVSIAASSGLRPGQTMTLQPNGSVPLYFAVVDATLNVEGGILDHCAEAFNSVVNISSGSVGFCFGAYSGSAVNISGGTVGGGFSAYDGSVVNFSGGEVGDSFHARGGSVINIFGNDFSIDGLELDTLVPGEAFTITDRDVTLTGLLADGEPFSFDLNSEIVAINNGADSEDLFRPDAMLTVTLASPVILGDVNLDGVVDFLDISPFIAVLSAATYQVQADCDESGVVDFLDISHFIGILSGN